MTPAAPPARDSRMASARDWADLAAGGAERPAQPDLGATLEDGDDHDVGDPDRADQQRDRAEAEEQGVERALGVGLGGRAADGWGTVTWPGVSALAWAPRRLFTAGVTARSCGRERS